MNITKPIPLKATLLLSLLLICPLAVAQEDRGERIQESVSSSDDRIDFTKSKAEPPKIESIAYQDSLIKTRDYKRAVSELARLERKTKKRATELGFTKLSAKDERALAAARSKVDKARAAMKEAERKANAD